ncbi:MAG: VWA domain-containing protein, partial [Planctomycetota bacterium]|nr:VWA domain-containing protein [Planctomycetota bacterium]
RDIAVSVLGAKGKSRRVTLALIEQFGVAKPPLQATLFGILSSHEVIPQLTALRLSVLDSQSVSMRAQALHQLARVNHRVVASRAPLMAADEEVHKNASASALVFFSLGTVLGRSTLPAFLKLGRKRSRVVDSHWRSLLAGHQKEVLPLVAGPALALPDPEHRLIATYLLTRVGSIKAKSKDLAVDGLIKALRDKSPIVVVTAMRALVQQRNRRVIPKLEANLESMNEDIRVQAMFGLHKFKGSSAAWGARLLKILKNATGASRLVALDLVTKMKLRPALSAVRGLFHHEAWQVRSAAYFFCLQVRDKDSVVPLIARLDKEDGRLHAEVLGTLRALTDLTYRDSKAWRGWWAKEGDDFKLAKLGKKAGVGRSAPAAMTYYSMSLNSNRVGFLVDTSGSMSAKVGTLGITRLDLAKKALSQVIEKCGEGFHFNLITFGSDGRRWKRELCPATVDNRASARQYVKGMRAAGGTNFFEALLMAFEDESIDTIYLLSDGTPTEGDITDQQELADEIELWNVKRQILIHTIAIGADSPIMRRLAEDSGGEHVQRR